MRLQIFGGLTGATFHLACTSHRTRLRRVRLRNNRRRCRAPPFIWRAHHSARAGGGCGFEIFGDLRAPFFYLTCTSNRTRRRRVRLRNNRRPDGRRRLFDVHITPHAPAAGAASNIRRPAGATFHLACTSHRTRLRRLRLRNNRRPAGAVFYLTFTSFRTRLRRVRFLIFGDLRAPFWGQPTLPTTHHTPQTKKRRAGKRVVFVSDEV